MCLDCGGRTQGGLRVHGIREKARLIPQDLGGDGGGWAGLGDWLGGEKGSRREIFGVREEEGGKQLSKGVIVEDSDVQVRPSLGEALDMLQLGQGFITMTSEFEKSSKKLWMEGMRRAGF